MEEITKHSGIDVDVFLDNWKKSGPPYSATTGQARLLDFDRDGHVDLLVTESDRPYLFRGTGEGRFNDVTAAAGLRFNAGEMLRGALVADFDNDRLEDQNHIPASDLDAVGVMVSCPTCRYASNTLLPRLKY